MRRAMWICVAVAAAAFSSHLRADCTSLMRSVSQPTVFPSHAAGPVAWSGSVLGVAKNNVDPLSPTHGISFALYDADLNPLTSDVQIIDDSTTGVLALTWNGSEFAVFYQTFALQLVFQRISANGQLVGTPVPVAANHPNWQNQEYAVTFDATLNAYVVVHTIPQGGDRGLWLTAVAPDGTIVSDENLAFFFASTAMPRVATSNGKIGVVWLYEDTQSNDKLALEAVDQNFHISGLSYVSISGRSPVVAASSTSFLVIDQAPVTGGTELRSTMTDLKANILSPDATFMPAVGVDIAPLSLLWNPTVGEWALMYVDSTVGFNLSPGDTRIHRFHIPASVPPSDTLFVPDTAKSTFAAAYPIVWTGTTYDGSILHQVNRPQGSDSWLVRYCPLSAAISAPALAPVLTSITFRALPSGGTPDYAETWDFGDLDSGVGAVVQHAYRRPGTYTVVLTVTDTAHGTATASTTVRVVIPRERAARH